MTEKTLKHEVYKHGSYLYSLKEAGSQFVNIDDEIDKFDELFELLRKKQPQTIQLADYINDNNIQLTAEQIKEALESYLNEVSQDPPAFKVGEYYATKTGIIYKVTAVQGLELKVTSLIDRELVSSAMLSDSPIAKHSTPATAEQIATFKRAEQFAKHGRKLDEFELGDEVYDELHGVGKVTATDTAGEVTVRYTYSIGTKEYCYGKGLYDQLELIQTAEELQEVADESKTNRT